jgi:hypothetical protein
MDGHSASLRLAEHRMIGDQARASLDVEPIAVDDLDPGRHARD